LNRKSLLGFFLFAAISVVLQTGCGGGNNPNATPPPNSGPPSKLTKRVLVANKSGAIEILDATNDVWPATNPQYITGTITSNYRIVGVNQPAYFIKGGGTNKISVFDHTTRIISAFDTTTEGTANTVGLAQDTDSIVLTSDGNSIYAAYRNTGQVQYVNISDNTKSLTFDNLSGARRLAISPDGKKVLVFRDNNDTVSIIDAATNTIATVSNTGAVAGVYSISRPYTAVFSADSTTAYILGCGLECGGGSSPTVTKMTFANCPAPTTGTNLFTTCAPALTSVNVDAATTAVMDSTNLYVVGTNVNVTPNKGTLTVLPLATLVKSATNNTLPDGLHEQIANVSNGKIYVGSSACTIAGTINGCLATYTISTNTAKTPSLTGFVTSIEPINGRTVVYVTVGGVLYIFDTTTDTLQTRQIQIIGIAQDARQIDP